MKVKQVILVRKDLADKYRGKMMAQICHASVGSLLKLADLRSKEEIHFTLERDGVLDLWLNGLFTKVALEVKDEEELMKYADELDKTDIPHALIVDSGLTVFHGQPTVTCLGIGPWDADKINEVTGNLRPIK